jgi:SAM-dependent methyltransferase
MTGISGTPEIEPVRPATARRSSCPLCGQPAPDTFLHLERMPVLQNSPAASAEAARAVPRGDLAITACPHCGFVYNATFDESLMRYTTSYDNTQCHSPLFRAYLEDLARHLVETHILHGKSIVEIGCGKGHFLRMLCDAGDNSGLGFDPAYEGPRERDGGRVRFVRDLYDDRHTGHPADLICCRHVLEHIPEPPLMLSAIRHAAGDRSVVFMEVPTVTWILEHDAFWDFFYEHCSYFSRSSLPWAFERAGFEVQDVREAFGGQYLWLEACPRRNESTAEAAGVADLLTTVSSFARRVETRIESWRRRIADYADAGGCAVWGAGAKGVTLLNRIDPDGDLVPFVIDVNPSKQGRFIPGTGHRIEGPSILARCPVPHIVATNPNYRQEIETEARRRLDADVAVSCL